MRTPITLLHIDDSAADRLLIKEALFLTKTPFVLVQADGFDSALEYFQGADPLPALVLLDYDLGGGHTGCDFLRWFRRVKKNNKIPVVMFSGSSGKQNVAECYAAGADYFVSKPHKMERFKVIVSTLFMSLNQPGVISQLTEFIPELRNKAPTASW